MLVTRGKGELSGVAIKGIDPTLVRGVLDLEKHMIQGSVDTLAKLPGPGELPRSSWQGARSQAQGQGRR